MTDVSSPQKLLWLDLEMTGLNPQKDRIIEAATIITDWQFKKLASYEAVIKQPAKLLKGMDDWNQLTHSQSGLLAKIPKGIGEKRAEAELVKLVEKHFSQPAILAGNSIHFDRQFIKRYWPKLEAKLHYRMLDVSALKLVMQAKYGHVFTKQEAHRAMDDVKESIAELKNYLAYFRKKVE